MKHICHFHFARKRFGKIVSAAAAILHHFLDQAFRIVDARVLRHHGHRGHQGLAHDFITGLVLAVETAQFFVQNSHSLHQRRAAAGDDPLFHCRARRVERVLDLEFAALHFRLRGRADFDNADPAGQFRQTFLEFFLVKLRSRRRVFLPDLRDAIGDFLLVPAALDDGRMLLGRDDFARRPQMLRFCRFHFHPQIRRDH